MTTEELKTTFKNVSFPELRKAVVGDTEYTQCTFCKNWALTITYDAQPITVFECTECDATCWVEDTGIVCDECGTDNSNTETYKETVYSCSNCDTTFIL